VLPRLMAVLQTAAFLFRHGAKIGCAHRNRTCLNGIKVRRLTDRPARYGHWSVRHDLNAPPNRVLSRRAIHR
jgi:hypothetical protein